MKDVLDFSGNKYGENVIKMASLLTPKLKYLYYEINFFFFNILLTVHLNIFIS